MKHLMNKILVVSLCMTVFVMAPIAAQYDESDLTADKKASSQDPLSQEYLAQGQLFVNGPSGFWTSPKLTPAQYTLSQDGHLEIFAGSLPQINNGSEFFDLSMIPQEYLDSITKITFGSKAGDDNTVKLHEFTTNIFAHTPLSNIKEVRFENVDTSKLTKLTGLFYNADAIETLYFSDQFVLNDLFDKNGLSNTFKGMRSLKNLQLSEGFDTSMITKLDHLFAELSSLETLILPDAFDTSNVTEMSGMFSDMSSLTKLVLGSGFNTSSVKSTLIMFLNVSSLETLDFNDQLYGDALTNMGQMFDGMTSLKELNLGNNFTTEKVEHMQAAFRDLDSIEKIKFGPNFNMKQIFNETLNAVADDNVLGGVSGRWIREDGTGIEASSYSLLTNYRKNNNGYEGYYVKEKYKGVTYDAGEGIGSVPVVTDLIKTGQKHTVLFDVIPVKDNARFIGWEYAGKVYSYGEALIMPYEDVVLTASYETDSSSIQSVFEITYKDHQNKILKVVEVYDGDDAFEIDAPAVETLEGSVFTGWKIENTDLYWVYENNPVRENITLVADYERIVYDVTFVDHDGNPIKRIQVGHGDLINQDKVPGAMRSDHTLVGWTPKNTETLWDFETDTIVSDLVLAPMCLEEDVESTPPADLPSDDNQVGEDQNPNQGDIIEDDGVIEVNPEIKAPVLDDSKKEAGNSLPKTGKSSTYSFAIVLISAGVFLTRVTYKRKEH